MERAAAEAAEKLAAAEKRIGEYEAVVEVVRRRRVSRVVFRVAEKDAPAPGARLQHPPAELEGSHIEQELEAGARLGR